MSNKTDYPFESVVIELRPRIRSANVFVRLKSANKSTIEAVLNEHSLKIDVGNSSASISLGNDIAVPTSLVQLKKTEEFALFWFAMNSEVGSFKSEVLQHQKHSSQSKKPDRSNHQHESFLFRGRCYNLKCINCTNKLSGDVYFTRALPLPSGFSDPSEWFCCASSSTGNPNMNPKVTDIFYTHCYAHINSKIVKNVMFSNNIAVCNRCLCWLGIIKKDEEKLKVWFNTVGFQFGTTLNKTVALDDIWFTIKEVLKLKLLAFTKFIFVCESAKNRTDYLLLWIIEKELSVILALTVGDAAQVSSDGQLEQHHFQVAKGLFKYQDKKTDLVEEWFSDPTVTAVSVSKPMIHALTRHLHKYNKMCPDEFSASNDYLLSYLLLY